MRMAKRVDFDNAAKKKMANCVDPDHISESYK